MIERSGGGIEFCLVRGDHVKRIALPFDDPSSHLCNNSAGSRIGAAAEMKGRARTVAYVAPHRGARFTQCELMLTLNRRTACLRVQKS
jgi:hypothetical protein